MQVYQLAMFLATLQNTVSNSPDDASTSPFKTNAYTPASVTRKSKLGVQMLLVSL